jgi:flavin-dependent dehydrogenase
VIEADVLVVGAGPAGAAAALNLAPIRRVVLIERRPEVTDRIGESLPPAARRLFADMGLLADFEAEGHAPYYGNRAVWGAPEPVDADFVRDPDGNGWHLDRARYEAWLRRSAAARGADLLAPARIETVERDRAGWLVQIKTSAGRVGVTAKILIEAGGRTAPLARRLGARRRSQDRLVCGWITGRAGSGGRGAGLAFVEATQHGWWYTAPLPAARRVLAFHTDADLPAARSARNPDELLATAKTLDELGAVLAEAGFVAAETTGYTAAHSGSLDPCAGQAWLAAGDAALSFDPISSQGLLNALFTGLAAAEASDRALAGVKDAIPEYGRAISEIHSTYRRHLAFIYGAETRWPDAPFWRRRRQSSIG